MSGNDGKTSEGYFDDASREGAPSAKLKDKGDFVVGEVVDLFKMPRTKFGTNEVILNDDGSEQTQLVLVLQTELRNWDKVAKAPTAADGTPKPGSEDKGLRAVYVPKYTNIHAALGKGIKSSGASDVEIGGKFGIKVTDLEPSGKGNPKKVHEARYTPPVKSESSGFSEFDSGATPTTTNDEAASKQVEEPPF